MDENNKILEKKPSAETNFFLWYYKYIAVKLALKMYDTFAQELITALSNTRNIWERAKWVSTGIQELSYYSGKADAFGEIANRVSKEYGLAKRGLECLNDTDEYKLPTTYLKNTELIDYAINIIKDKKNKDTDTIFPEYKYRGSQMGREILRKKGQVADVLENYACEAFSLGVIAQRKFAEIIPDSLTPEKFNAELERFKKDFVFDPDKFAETISKDIIPENMKDAIEQPDNLKHIYPNSRQYDKVKKKKED